MTVLTFEIEARRASGVLATWAHKLAQIGRDLLDAFDAFAATRAQHALSVTELRRVDREINRYRRMMRGDLARQVGGSLSGSAVIQRLQRAR